MTIYDYTIQMAVVIYTSKMLHVAIPIYIARVIIVMGISQRKPLYTVDGESYAWEKVREFHEFSYSRETFPPVHFKFHWNQQYIVGIAKLFHRYAK